MRLVVPLVFFLFIVSHAGAQPTVSQGKVPAWVTQHEYIKTISDTTETSDGYAYLLISRQANLESKEVYAEYVMKVTAEKGLSIVSAINEYFDPAFQKLTFHKLNIIRNGKTINKLNPGKFDVIRREDEMERAIYDKSVNAIYNLPDVRVGDIVEYSFTRKGFNPVFKDHCFGTFYLQFGIPVAKFAYKLVYGRGRPVQFKSFGNTGVSTTEGQGHLKSTTWIRENVPALLTDDQYPSWYDPYPHLQYSDFQSWNDVKQWALALYAFPKLKNGGLKEAIDSIRLSGGSDEQKIRECIRIAQGDIRYLSFSDGVNGYKPHAPEMVYDQKYGDCKDKSFMLSTMLTELGISSKPALVSTDNGYKLEEVLPNPYAFNHCIVQFTHNDSTYWIDPTLNAQVGPLKSYYFPTYHRALVISNDEAGLTPIPFGYKEISGVDVKEEYSMMEVGGNVTLEVKTTYTGDEADEIRSYFTSNTTDQIDKDYLNFYAKDYSDISITKDFEFTDDRELNVITSSEEYLIKNFWEIEDGNKSADISASYLMTFLKKPDTRLRTMPLAITHPRNISQTIKIRLPEEWNIEDSEIKIESDAFTYRSSVFYANKVITLRYRYNTKASFVAAEKVADHVEKIDQVFADAGYNIYKTLDDTEPATSRAYVIIAVLIVVGVYVARKKLGR